MSTGKNKRGRPNAVTPKKLALLLHAFDIGSTDEEACASAQISTSTLYNYQTDNPDFLEEKETRKLKPVLLAREIIFNALSSGDVAIAKWYLERKKKDEFASYLIDSTQEKQAKDKIKDDPRVFSTLMGASVRLLENMGFVVTHPDVEIHKNQN